MSSTPAASSARKGSATPKVSVRAPNKHVSIGSKSSKGSKKTAKDAASVGRDKESTTSGTSCSSKKKSRARNKQQDSVSIVVTNTAHERMRNMSVLTLDEDQFDRQPHRNGSMLSNDSEGKRTLNTVVTDQTEKEVLASRISKAAHETECPEEATLLNAKSKTPSKVPNRSNKPREFSFPATLASEESDRRHRTRSLNANECLVEIESEIHPSAVSQQNRSGKHSMDGVQDDSTDDECQRAVQITRRGMEVRGFIAPTTKQRQLMRKVSGLGMEDPVFGKIAEQLNPAHASNFFDDMDLDDVPEDMKDMMTFVSDRTDAVDLDDDILDSPAGSSHLLGSQFESSLRAMSNFHNSCSSLPPLGLDPGTMMMLDIVSPRRSQTKRFPSRAPPPPPPPQDKSAKSTKTNRKSTYEAPLPPSYTPPAGSFVRKKVSKKPSGVDKSNVMKRDDRLAATVDAMFQKSMSASEFPSKGFASCLSPTQADSKSPSPRSNRRRSMGDGCDSFQMVSNHQGRRMSTSSVFVPTELPAIGQRSSPFRDDERRTLPSMDALFPDAAGATPIANIPTTVIAPRRGSQGSRERSKTPTQHGLPPCFSPPKPSGQSKKIPSNFLPPTAAYSSTRKSTPAYSVKAKRRDTASTTDMSPSSSLDTDGRFSYPENPAR